MLEPTFSKTTHLVINFILVTNDFYILHTPAAKNNYLFYSSVNNLFPKTNILGNYI